MPPADVMSYFLTLVAIALAPGPVALVLLVRSASGDVAGAAGFGGGFAFGGLLIISVVCYGLSEWLTAAPSLFIYSKYIMFSYILWISLGLWRSGFRMTQDADVNYRPPLASFGAGIATCLISPYMMILFPVVLPGMMDVTTLALPQFLIIALATVTALATGATLIIVFAAQINRLARTPLGLQRVNRSLAGVLTLAGGWMAFA